ncbi:hypothetical protein H634G_06429 [Metarhizium anisopliae BRIP 53293]|uniref:Major facilitator superfamily (MFS) profile domain-containing protein n=1 Tax=Metarhizium anisopliae BRIP 53293 TaxID=1291518 RepID=A0A0D9NWM4_METAN|nr:hypothetical protein H634G_06429 [Metarhizium anisopliae BRIP 53293]KJK92756.1 hypothetical protein H633G_03380 [Metarhizium anisopliae BRIP 53284]
MASPRDRGNYLSIILSTAALGAIVGPVVGGALAQRDWRWCFYINLLICVLALPVMVLSLRIKHLRVPWTVVFTQVDWAGNVMFWSSCRTMTPIVMGTVALAGFHTYEYYIKAANQCVPPHAFSNRTLGAAFYMVFVSSMLLQWVCFFWPVYFLAVRGASLGQTEVDFLPCMFLLFPGSAVVGIILSKTGRYCPLHAVGFVLSTLGPGLNVLLDKDTHAGVWAMLQIADADVASTTGMYSFLRSFGYVWGITIPSIMFKNRFDAVSYQISDPAVRSALGGGRASELSTGAFVQALLQPVKSQVLDAHLETLKAGWYGVMAFGATALIAVAVEKHVPLRTELGSKYEMEEKANKDRQDVEAATGGVGQDHCVDSSITFVYRASLGAQEYLYQTIYRG